MNIRLESINFLRKIYNKKEHDYTESELQEISKYLVQNIVKVDELNKRIKKLFEIIKEKDEKISSFENIIRENTPKTKGKEVELYNYIELKTINEALEMFIKENLYALRENRAIVRQPIEATINISREIIEKNDNKLEKIKSWID